MKIVVKHLRRGTYVLHLRRKTTVREILNTLNINVYEVLTYIDDKPVTPDYEITNNTTVIVIPITRGA